MFDMMMQTCPRRQTGGLTRLLIFLS